MFEADIEANRETLTREIRGKKVCVIGGAGPIGFSFIKTMLHFEPIPVGVVDVNENGLVVLVILPHATAILQRLKQSGLGSQVR